MSTTSPVTGSPVGSDHWPSVSLGQPGCQGCDDEVLTVTFTAVHRYQVTVHAADFDGPGEVDELLTAAAIDQPGALIDVESRKIIDVVRSGPAREGKRHE